MVGMLAVLSMVFVMLVPAASAFGATQGPVVTIGSELDAPGDSGTVVPATPNCCQIVQTGALFADPAAALAAVQEGQTIQLLHDIVYNQSITISDTDFAIDLNGYTFDVAPVATSYALEVVGCEVKLLDSVGGGEFNVDNQMDPDSDAQPGYGVVALNGARVTVTNVTGYYGVLADGQFSDPTIVIPPLKAVAGSDASITVTPATTVTVLGDVTATGSMNKVMGNIPAMGPCGVIAQYADVEVDGNVINNATVGTAGGVYAMPYGNITVKGNISVSGVDSLMLDPIPTYGAYVVSHATATIEGTITIPVNGTYVRANDTSFLQEDGTRTADKPDYLQYSDDTGFVWVRIATDQPPVGAPASGDLFGTGEVTMDVAMIVAQIVTGSGMELTPAQFAAVDMDQDGYLTMNDVMLIMQKAAGM